MNSKVARFQGGPSTSEIIRRDAKFNVITATESYRFLGDDDISVERYISRDIYDREMRSLWPRTWQWACREEQIPEEGDFIVYEVGQYSFVLIRGDDGSIRAFYNSCMHRGTKLLAKDAAGSLGAITCPFHGWQWDLDGSLKKVQDDWDFSKVCGKSHDLPQARVECWSGFVFINMDENAPGLLEYMDVIPAHLQHFKLEDRYIDTYVSKELACNWKAGLEAFLEAYHVQSTHPQLLGATSDSNGQYDVFGQHVTRRVAAGASPSPNVNRNMTEQEILDFMSRDARTRTGERLTVGEGETARMVMARHMRNNMQARYGVDLSAYTDGDILDTLEYHLFPNMLIFANLSLSMVYRFRPLGDNHERTLFEIMFLRPCTPGKPRPEPADCFPLHSTDSYTTVLNLDKGMGAIYDQDTAILAAQQQGFHASRRGKITLGNYQEVRIRHFEQIVEKYSGV